MNHPSWPLHLFSMDWLSFVIVTSIFHGLVESAIEVGASPPVFQGQVELTAFEIFIEIFVASPLHLFSMDWLSNLCKIFVTSVLHDFALEILCLAFLSFLCDSVGKPCIL